MENAGGDGFNEFLMDILSFWCANCLCNWIRSYLPPKKYWWQYISDLYPGNYNLCTEISKRWTILHMTVKLLRRVYQEEKDRTFWFCSFKKIDEMHVIWRIKVHTHRFMEFVVKNWYFVTKIVLTYWEKKIVLAIEKNFWNSRLKAENLQNIWNH